MGNVNHQFLLSMLIIALGFLGKKLNVVSEKDGEGISDVIFNFTMPALVMKTFNNIRIDRSLALLPLTGILYGGAVALLALAFFRKEPRKQRGMLAMAVPGFNIGLFAFPLVEGVWGSGALKYFAMFDMGNAFILFVLCYIIGSYFASEGSKVDYKYMLRQLTRSVPLMVYIFTLVMRLSGLHYPGVVMDVAGILAPANMPLSLLLMGVYLSFSLERQHKINLLKVLALRYLMGIATGIILYIVLPIGPMLRNTLLAALILPMGMAVIPYTIQFGYDQKFAATVANVTNIISFALIWILFSRIPVF